MGWGAVVLCGWTSIMIDFCSVILPSSMRCVTVMLGGAPRFKAGDGYIPLSAAMDTMVRMLSTSVCQVKEIHDH